MSRRAAFVDRDGTIIVEKDYLSDPAQAVLLPDAAAGLRRLADLGLALVVISNQSGVGRGYFAMDDVTRVNQRVDELLRADGVEVDGWYICPHAPDADCRCRKPRPGMVEEACRDLDLDARRSFVIGDKQADLDLGLAVEAAGFLVTTGYGARAADYARKIGRPVCESLLDAARLIAAELGTAG